MRALVNVKEEKEEENVWLCPLNQLNRNISVQWSFKVWLNLRYAYVSLYIVTLSRRDMFFFFCLLFIFIRVAYFTPHLIMHVQCFLFIFFFFLCLTFTIFCLSCRRHRHCTWISCCTRNDCYSKSFDLRHVDQK